MPGGLLLVALVTIAPVVEVLEGSDLDATVLRRGLEVRLGETARGWDVRVDGTTAEVVHLRLRSPEGREIHRSIALGEETTEARSRELASAVAFIIESHHDDARAPSETDDPSPDVAHPERPLLGWIALGPRLGLGSVSSPDPDYGLGARGGVWMVGDHVQPIASVGWSRSADGPLVLDGLRVGAGAAFGSRLGERLWVGAGVIPHASWTRAADRVAVTGWRSSTELSALLQVRGRWGLFAVRGGMDLTLPPVRAVGSDSDLRWGPARFVLGLEFGLAVPPRRN